MDWRFTIIDRDNIATVIEEPVGWDQGTSEIKRDPDYHGVFFTNQGDNFEFHDAAMRLIKAEYDVYGFEGEMTLVMEENCGNGYEEFARGRFDFNRYDYTCGESCFVKIPVEKSGETIELRSRLNQKVNLETLKAFDTTTDLPPYAKLPFDLSLPSKGISMQDKAEWEVEAITTVNLNEVPEIVFDGPESYNWGWFQIVPQFENIKFSEFGRFTTAIAPEHSFIKSGWYFPGIDPSLELVVDGFFTPGPDTRKIYFDWALATALLVNEGNANNFDVVNNFSCDLAYSFEMQLTNANIGSLYNVLCIRRKDGSFEYLQKQRIFSGLVGGGPGGFDSDTIWLAGSNNTVSFAATNSGIELYDGDYLFTVVCGLAFYSNLAAHFELEAYKLKSISGSVLLQALSHSAPSTSKVFAINETISRVVESITNNKLKGFSEYFGRTDSEPYPLPADGCGSLEVVTDGIRIRRQENKIPGTTNLLSLSLQDIFEGLSPIHNIGMGIEADTNRPGFNRLRVEPWYYFYNDSVIMSCTDINKINRKANDKDAFSTFQFGYDKWEAEEYNGLDEFLTKRIFRTTLSMVKNDLIKLSKWISSGYAIEVTKRKAGSTKDWRFDKEVFIICCKRDGSNQIVVELGNVISATNIVDPATLYNYRISPIRNALRWMNKVFASYKQFGAGCQLIFTDGTGNYFASGEMESATCKIESGVLGENQTIDISVFANEDDARPRLAPERVLFDYPMSSKDYKNMEANPYGLIYFSSDCDEGYGHIDTINYKMEEGLASFNLIPKAM